MHKLSLLIIILITTCNLALAEKIPFLTDQKGYFIAVQGDIEVLPRNESSTLRLAQSDESTVLAWRDNYAPLFIGSGQITMLYRLFYTQQRSLESISASRNHDTERNALRIRARVVELRDGILTNVRTATIASTNSSLLHTFVDLNRIAQAGQFVDLYYEFFRGDDSNAGELVRRNQGKYFIDAQNQLEKSFIQEGWQVIGRCAIYLAPSVEFALDTKVRTMVITESQPIGITINGHVWERYSRQPVPRSPYFIDLETFGLGERSGLCDLAGQLEEHIDLPDWLIWQSQLSHVDKTTLEKTPLSFNKSISLRIMTNKVIPAQDMTVSVVLLPSGIEELNPKYYYQPEDSSTTYYYLFTPYSPMELSVYGRRETGATQLLMNEMNWAVIGCAMPADIAISASYTDKKGKESLVRQYPLIGGGYILFWPKLTSIDISIKNRSESEIRFNCYMRDVQAEDMLNMVIPLLSTIQIRR